MAKYVVTVHRDQAADVIVEAATPDEALEKAIEFDALVGAEFVTGDHSYEATSVEAVPE